MDPEKVLNEILYILWTGAPWRSLNAKGASHFQTVHGHFRRKEGKQITQRRALELAKLFELDKGELTSRKRARIA